MSKPAKRQQENTGAFDVEVGARIEAVMQAAQLNHYSLAAKSGIDRAYLTKLINGKRRANMDLIRDLAKALDVAPAALLPGGEALGSTGMSDPASSVLPDGSWRITVRTPEAEHVALIVDALDKQERKQILDYAQRVEGKEDAGAEQGSGRARRKSNSGPTT